jgi:hypothetical protein
LCQPPPEEVPAKPATTRYFGDGWRSLKRRGRILEGVHAMEVAIELPKAFSVRDEREFPLIRNLVARLNPKLLVIQVATGMHVNGGFTDNWGLVYLEGQPLTEREVHAALNEAGLDFEHNAEIQASRIWVNNHPDLIEETCGTAQSA